MTAAMEVPCSFTAKFQWLERHFPFLPPDNIVFCGNKGIIAADYLIDDNVYQLDRFRGEGILFTTPHNFSRNEIQSGGRLGRTYGNCFWIRRNDRSFWWGRPSACGGLRRPPSVPKQRASSTSMDGPRLAVHVVHQQVLAERIGRREVRLAAAHLRHLLDEIAPGRNRWPA